MEESRQNNPISTHERSQDAECDARDESQADEPKGSRALVGIAKLGSGNCGIQEMGTHDRRRDALGASGSGTYCFQRILTVHHLL